MQINYIINLTSSTRIGTTESEHFAKKKDAIAEEKAITECFVQKRQRDEIY